MKKITLIAIITIISIALILSISGCTKKIAETMVEEAIENVTAKEGESVDVNLEEGQVNITDEQGNEISLGGAKVPDDWPSEVPVNKDIQIQYAGSQKTDGKMTWMINGFYQGSGEDLYKYYKSELSTWNEDLDSVADVGGSTTYTYQVSNDKYSLTIIIGKAAILGENEDGIVSIVINVNEK